MVDTVSRWLLPPGIEEELLDDARHIEYLRRRLLDLFEGWGYEQVVPPLVEYLDSLLVVDDKELQAQTLKLTDHHSGRMMGLRADMTPQVARIDANRLVTEHINRLCYVGTVLRAIPENVGDMRRIVQFGAEMYGHSGIDSNVEIIRLMVAAIRSTGLSDLHLDIGHIGIYLDLLKASGLNRDQENALFDLMHLRSVHEIEHYLNDQNISREMTDNFVALLELHGDVSVLDKAGKVFSGVDVARHLGEIKAVSEQLERMDLDVRMHYDLAELGHYQYETGIVFSVLNKAIGQEIACGGRYDNIGKAFGRARAAVGFSSDLTLLAALSREDCRLPGGIWAPAPTPDNPAYAEFHQTVKRLRDSGERVVEQLDDASDAATYGCDKILVLEDKDWKVKEV